MAEGPLALRPAAGCRWDLVAAGEVMLRLDPGDGLIATTRNFQVWEGGGEYNVARGLRRCFGLRTSVVTALADNPIGRLIEDLLLQGGVDISHLRWAPFDGIGRSVRNGLNFTERGFGARAALGCSDRANSATSQLQPGELPWGDIFGSEGARWFHTGGIFAGLSESTAAVAAEAMSAARQAGTTVSYDLNFRPSLWKAAGGAQRAVEVNRRLVAMTDVLFGNGDDFSSALGFDVADAHFQRQAVGHALAVARQQQLATQAQFTQLLHRLAGFRFHAVRQQQPGEELPIQRQPGNRAIVVGDFRGRDAQLFKQFRPTEGGFALPGLRDHTEALALANIRQHQHLFLSRQPRQCPADRVAAGGAEAGRQVEQHLPIRLAGVDGLQTQGAKRQGAGLVDHQ